MRKQLPILVFAAHPDDEVIGCGGSIAKHIKAGNSVEVVYFTSSDASGDVSRAHAREKEARNACKILGVSNPHFMRRQGRFLKYDKEILEDTVRTLKESDPSYVYTHHPSDGDRDHVIAYRITNEACWLASKPYMPQCGPNICHISGVLLYEICRPILNYQYVEDISGYMNVKLKALKEYKSQLLLVRYDEAVKGLNRYRGIMSGHGEYAEVFGIKHFERFFNFSFSGQETAT